jgi:hypothetical protein
VRELRVYVRGRLHTIFCRGAAVYASRLRTFGIDGPTDPVFYEDQFIRAKVEVPRKCARCPFLFHHSIYGFACRKDEHKWGACYRGLDWGAWSPDRLYLELPHPKVTTKVLVDRAYGRDLVGFITEHRRINPSTSMADARADFARFRELIDNRASLTHEMGEPGASADSSEPGRSL